MANVSFDEERNAIDYVTQCMYSTALLHNISEVIFSNQADRVTVGEFYRQWLRHVGAPELKIPFSPGAVLGYLLIGILWTKEHWYDLVPDVGLPLADPEWALNTAKPAVPKRPNPTLRYLVRRVRNSLAHGRAVLHVPPDTTTETLMQRATLTFRDINDKDPADTFELTVTIDHLSRFVRTFQLAIHQDVRKRMEAAGIELPPRLGVERPPAP